MHVRTLDQAVSVSDYLKGLERPAVGGDSPVRESRLALAGVPKYPGTRETLGESGRTTS